MKSKKHIYTINSINTISAMQGNLENVGATHLLNASKLNTNITIDLKINNGCLDNSV